MVNKVFFILTINFLTYVAGFSQQGEIQLNNKINGKEKIIKEDVIVQVLRKDHQVLFGKLQILNDSVILIDKEICYMNDIIQIGRISADNLGLLTLGGAFVSGTVLWIVIVSLQSGNVLARTLVALVGLPISLAGAVSAITGLVVYLRNNRVYDKEKWAMKIITKNSGNPSSK